MILDKLLFNNISKIGSELLSECDINKYPKNILEMKIFLENLKCNIDNNTFNGAVLGDILFSFVSNIEIRDRNTTSRIFEDIFSNLFSVECTDNVTRSNPPSTKEISNLDLLSQNEGWSISTDLSGNKREKSDLSLGDYHISLKTLKGKAYDITNKLINSSENKELNIGSLSYRALLKGILTDDELQRLSDRRGGLGSGSQIRQNVLNPIILNNKQNEFLYRLQLFLPYVYAEDIYIVLKSHYKLTFILIPNNSFVNAFINTYIYDEPSFQNIFYRWENNNLRTPWQKILVAMDKYNLPYFKVDIILGNAFNNKELISFKQSLNNDIRKYINREQL